MRYIASALISVSVLLPSAAMANTVEQKVPVYSTEDCYTLANRVGDQGWFLALAALDEYRQPTCTFRGDVEVKTVRVPDEATCGIAAAKLDLYLSQVLTYRNQPFVVCEMSQKIQ